MEFIRIATTNNEDMRLNANHILYFHKLEGEGTIIKLANGDTFKVKEAPNSIEDLIY